MLKSQSGQLEVRPGSGQHSGELGTKRGLGDLFRVCSIKRKTGEGLGKCMRLNVVWSLDKV